MDRLEFPGFLKRLLELLPDGPAGLALIAAIGLLLVFTVVITLRVHHRWAVGRMKRRFARGREGETRAVGLLEAHGYRVLATQLTGETGLRIDDDWRPVTVRADLLVEKDGRQFVVEVKTGQVAPDPASSVTRRQLFEYHHVFDADGLLLADMERDRLLRIEFDEPEPPPAPPSLRSSVLLYLFGLLCGAAGMWWWRGG